MLLLQHCENKHHNTLSGCLCHEYDGKMQIHVWMQTCV